MTESAVHIKLVEELSTWIVHNLLSGDSGHIFVHHPSEAYVTPPIMFNSIPDVYVPPINGDRMIIGEAKTSNDIENTHTYDQLSNYLLNCTQYDNSIVVLAVPWDTVPLMSSVILHQQRITYTQNVKVEVLDKLFPWE